MSGFARGLQHHAIRETEFRSASKPRQRGADYLGFLKDKIPMVEEHVDSDDELFVRKLEDGVEYPNHFDKHDV